MTASTKPGPDAVAGGEESAPVLRLAMVINWRDLGRWLWAYLPEDKYQADLIFAAPEPDRRQAYRLPRFASEIWYLFRRRPNLQCYHVVFAWELRAALAALSWRRLTGQRRPSFVLIAPIFKGIFARAAPLLRFLLADVDRFICFSHAECQTYAALLRLPSERFLFHPITWTVEEGVATHDGGYVLALGQSNRDYRTLLEAVQDTDIPVTIVCGDDKWLGGQQPPPNVTLLFGTGHHETTALIAGATFHAIPLHDADYSSGQTVLLRAMACGKAVIVSDISGTRDYVRDGETALLVPTGDVAALRRELMRLWSNPVERERLGRNAEQAVRDEFSFPRLAQSLATLAEELAV